MSELVMDWLLPSSGIRSSPARKSGMPAPLKIVRTTKAIRTIITSRGARQVERQVASLRTFPLPG